MFKKLGKAFQSFHPRQRWKTDVCSQRVTGVMTRSSRLTCAQGQESGEGWDLFEKSPGRAPDVCWVTLLAGQPCWEDVSTGRGAVLSAGGWGLQLPFAAHIRPGEFCPGPEGRLESNHSPPNLTHGDTDPEKLTTLAKGAQPGGRARTRTHGHRVAFHSTNLAPRSLSLPCISVPPKLTPTLLSSLHPCPLPPTSWPPAVPLSL